MSDLPELEFLMRDQNGRYQTLAFWKCACPHHNIHPYWQLVCERCRASRRPDSFAPVGDIFSDPHADKMLLGQVQMALLQEATEQIQAVLENAAICSDVAVIARLETLENYLLGGFAQ